MNSHKCKGTARDQKIVRKSRHSRKENENEMGWGRGKVR